MKKLLLASILSLLGIYCFSQEFGYYELENLVNRDLNQGLYICNGKGLRYVGTTYEGLTVPGNVKSYFYEQVGNKGDVMGIVELYCNESDPNKVAGVLIFSKSSGTYLNVIKEAQRIEMQKSDEQSNNDTISVVYQDKNIYIFFANYTSESAKYNYEIHFERKLE
jgi:hypothetical protein